MSKGGRPRVSVCKRGHDQTVEGTRDVRGACNPCKKDRRKEKESALPQEPKASVPQDAVEALLELQALSTRTRKSTPLGHAYRQAGDMLAELAVAAMKEYGVTATGLSRQMGLSDKTLPYFLMRRGAIPRSAHFTKNQAVYKNEHIPGRPMVTHCKRGHDYAEEGARDKWGTCRKCSRDRKHRSYHEKKAS